jgi:hypothetical protein
MKDEVSLPVDQFDPKGDPPSKPDLREFAHKYYLAQYMLHAAGRSLRDGDRPVVADHGISAEVLSDYPEVARMEQIILNHPLGIVGLWEKYYPHRSMIDALGTFSRNFVIREVKKYLESKGLDPEDGMEMRKRLGMSVFDLSKTLDDTLKRDVMNQGDYRAFFEGKIDSYLEGQSEDV